MARKARKDPESGDTKDRLITVRAKPDIHRQFKAAAILRGSSMSGQIHQFMVRMIREERDRDPGEFAEVLVRIMHEEESHEPEKPERKTQSSSPENEGANTRDGDEDAKEDFLTVINGEASM